jgi:hypothetical protein
MMERTEDYNHPMQEGSYGGYRDYQDDHDE